MDYVEWIEPWGKNQECVLINRATVADAIYVWRQGHPDWLYLSDEDALHDFIVVNWATLKKEIINAC